MLYPQTTMPRKRQPPSNLLELPTVPTTAKQLHPTLRSFLELDENEALPEVPTASLNILKDQIRKVIFLYACTPGLIALEELTEEQKGKLSAMEVGLYQLMQKIQDKDCDFGMLRYVLDMTVGPPTQKTESFSIKADFKDWREIYQETQNEITVSMAEARAIEQSKLQEDHYVDAD